MNLCIRYIPDVASELDVTRSIASVLHSEEFAPSIDERPINFSVDLNPSQLGGMRNNGTGTLTLPSITIGNRFLGYIKENPLTIITPEARKKVKFYKTKPPPAYMALTLEKTPYVSPDIEEEHTRKLGELEDLFRIETIQFGLFYRPQYPTKPGEKLGPRSFSIEWEQSCVGWMNFEYGHTLLRITLGDRLVERTGTSIAINFSNINKIGVGYDGSPYLCFDLITPPFMEQVDFHRTTTGDHKRDSRKFKHRIGHIHPGHAAVAPYAPDLRVVLYNDPNGDIIRKFITMCEIAGIPKSRIVYCPPLQPIESFRAGLFSAPQLYHLRQHLIKFPWPVSFQLESLLRSGLTHSFEIFDLIPQIKVLLQKHPGGYVGDLLKQYHETLEARQPIESPLQCFKRISKKYEEKYKGLKLNRSPGDFPCYHATITPTRMILEGPYPTKSNRVIRKYRNYCDYFIRVDFKDEDRLSYRWDKETDGSWFLQERVGGVLKGGFDLAGRHFEFLAYSTSALREHAVWFMSKFEYVEEGQPRGYMVDSQYVRNSLGSFESDLLKCPSKYAARLAQAFTATDPSITICRNQWEEVPDLKPTDQEGNMFTDGVGTISKQLGNQIWKKLCEGRQHQSPSVQPSAYQIRFLGYKGVVGVDEQLGIDGDDIHMRLRPSMRKFRVADDGEAPIEIAQAFEYPKAAHLNRPLVMLLEDLGVRKDAFQELQDMVVSKAITIDDSIESFREVLNSHGLGNTYRVSTILDKLRNLNLELKTSVSGQGIDYPFLKQIRQAAKIHVLREIKHEARISIPDSYLLVGVADEGPAYKERGYKDVFTLQENQIYACIQKPDDPEPTWIEGSCSISRSPVTHPGDVRRVRAIGKPPKGKLCLFAHMKNVVVLPSVGKRSLASCLAGGDLDGDEFSIICHRPLLPSTTEDSADYDDSIQELDLGRDSTVDDICNFVVEYIHSDVLGLLSDRLLTIADQSNEGMHDESCKWLSKLCSQAVDYPKRGIPVDLDSNELPKPLIRCKPDWHAAEVISPRHTDYYESSRALGYLYRSIKWEEPDFVPPDNSVKNRIRKPMDPISLALQENVEFYIGPGAFSMGESPEIARLLEVYTDELRYICAVHSIASTPGVRLAEVEIVVGTILAKCTQKRRRKDRIYAMTLHAWTVVDDIRREFAKFSKEVSVDELICGLRNSWGAWLAGLCHENEFGAGSFALIALGVVFDCLEKLSFVLPYQKY